MNAEGPQSERIDRASACIGRLYELDEGPDWAAALAMVVELLEAEGGVLIDKSAGLKPLAVHRLGFAWLDSPLLDSGTGQVGRQVGLHTAQRNGRQLIWLVDGVPEGPPALPLSAVVHNLQLAVDYATPSGGAMHLSGRLVAPDADRVAEVDQQLRAMRPRARRCVLLAARGFTNAQISTYLKVAPGTVARSLKAAYRHLEVAGRSDLDVAALLSFPKPDRA